MGSVLVSKTLKLGSYSFEKKEAVLAYKMYDFLQVAFGHAQEVAQEIKKIDGVVVELLTGPYDVVVIVEEETREALGKKVLLVESIPFVRDHDRNLVGDHPLL